MLISVTCSVTSEVPIVVGRKAGSIREEERYSLKVILLFVFVGHPLAARERVSRVSWLRWKGGREENVVDPGEDNAMADLRPYGVSCIHKWRN